MKGSDKSAGSEAILAEDIFDRVAFYLVQGTVLLSLVLFLPLSYDWLGVTRVTLLRLGTLAALFVWFLKYVRLPVIRRSRFDFPILVFLFLATLSTMVSLHAPTSFLGQYYRYQGLSTLIVYGMLYFLAAQVATKFRTRFFFHTLTIVAAVISLYGVLQYMGIDFVSWGIRWESNRSFATLGNPVFLGGFLALVFPIAATNWLASRDRARSTLFGFSSLLILAALLATFSRGAWIALFVALIGLFILFWEQFRQKIQVFAVVIITVGLLAVVASAASGFRSNDALTFVERIASLKNVREGSIGVRLLVWESTLEVVRKRPWLGWGPDTFALVYPRASTLEEARTEGYLRLTDNAHNYPLQVAATQGGLGLWSLLTIIVLVVALARRISASSFPEVAGLWLGLLSYFVYLLSGIVSVETGALFWVVLGLFSSGLSPASQGDLKPSGRKKMRPAGSSEVRYGLISVTGLAVAALVVMSASVYLADVYFSKAKREARTGEVEVAEDYFRASIRLNPWLDLYPRHLGRMYADAATELNDRELAQAGMAAYLEAETRSPQAVDNYGFLGDLYLVSGQLFDSRYYVNAEEELKKAAELYPYWADVRSDLGILYFQTGRFPQTIQQFNRVLSISPTDEKALLYLGRSYQVLDKRKEAISAFRRLIQVNPSHEEAKRALSELTGK